MKNFDAFLEAYKAHMEKPGIRRQTPEDARLIELFEKHRADIRGHFHLCRPYGQRFHMGFCRNDIVDMKVDKEIYELLMEAKMFWATYSEFYAHHQGKP